ncbi:E3 ubiquitin-protein ligase tom1 [Didymosphaeria variabile]|uniref:HECT-type E3 ubiquitin transferase n=1 Tax=Didymosphaeria variabile TaxID=1932322 RepID=A0A9W9CD23_9PLEO|nr:E3 ubiquitin-protein ligase tom1 [Didymosphaeria variabile]KAJ4356260.1 E3 ubiquitin-protein ligase tom1 [Didymosphaeria variabile]
MKIKKQATSRHESTLSPMIADFVKATESIPLYQIPAHLASFPKLWPFPRGDTYHWIPVLNRFDRILELFIRIYGLENGPQTQPFQRLLLQQGDAEEGKTSEPATADILDKLHIASDGDRELIEQILGFTRLLLENCGNRSLYSSSGHLDKLLNSTSVTLVKATLRLSLRLSQRYYSARMRLAPATLHPTLLASHYNINLEKMQKLAAPFPKGLSTAPLPFATPAGKGKDKALGERRSENDRVYAADMVGLFTLPEGSVKQEYGGVLISYYEPSSTSEENQPPSVEAHATAAPATPTPVRRTSNMNPQQTPRQSRDGVLTDPPLTPAFTPGDVGTSRPTGAKSFEKPSEIVSSADIHELLKEGLEELPENVHYELLHKVRSAKTLVNGKNGREDGVGIRMLAIANLAYVYGEKDFHAKLGQQDTDEPRRLQWAYQLSELVHPPSSGDGAVSLELQTYALCALEALAKHKSKSSDICTALSVNVNHGVLFYVVRKLVAELAVDDDSVVNAQQEEWREALFSLLNTLPTSQARTGDGMVSAGLIEILVDVLKLRTAKAERNHPKILNFLDTFVHNLREAFQALVDAKGLDIIADLVFYEVTTSRMLAEAGEGIPKEYKTQLTDYQIPFYNQQTLRWLFKFMNHMMSHTGGGNFDRQMRNLIDSTPLQQGLEVVLSNANVFGSTVWSMGVNILTTFIHNEPTSYAVINDAGLSTALLETVSGEKIPMNPTNATDKDATSSADTTSADRSASPPRPARVYPPRDPNMSLASGILPVAEAISTIPPAFGAICLAEAGMKLFQSSAALTHFFEIFESPAHVKALDMDPEIPTIIGNAFDELVRHHPPLKNPVLASLSEMVARVVRICFDKAEKEGAGTKLYYEDHKDEKIYVCGGRPALSGPEGFIHKQLSQQTSSEDDVLMADAHDTSSSSLEPVALLDVLEIEDRSAGPSTSQYISVVCRFLGGFFTNNAMCAAYIEADGVETILDLATLPCLDARFNETQTTSEEFARVVQVLVEQKPHIAVPALLKRTQQALDRLEPLMQHAYNEGKGFFALFTGAVSDLDPEQQKIRDQGTQYVKSLLAVHTLVSALTTTFQGQMFNTRSSHNVSSQVNLSDMYARLVDSLGRLHRSCVWEEILLQKNMPKEWEKETRVKSSGFGAIEADSVFNLGNNDRSTEPPAASSNDETAGTAPGSSSDAPTPSQNSARFKNTQILRYLLSKIPPGIAPFFQSLGKLLLFRRTLESYQKQGAIIVGDQLAQAAIDQLRFEAPKASASAEDRYAYWIVILTSLSQLMIDNNMDRVSPQALTLILVSFRNLGGLAVLADILNTFFESAKDVIQTQGEQPSEDYQRLLNLSLGGVKIVLAFYAQIINAKVINEATQTTSMQSRPDRDRERPDFFLAPQFIVELRHAVTKPVQKIWNSDLIDKATTSIVKTSINILKTVLDGEGEHGAYKSVDKIPKRSKPVIRPWKPRNSEHMQRLKDASQYPESLAEEALFRCCDNFNTAREYCQNQVRDVRASRNPIPPYEIDARRAPNVSPSRAEVVVPEPVENASTSASEDADGPEGWTTQDSQSVEMEDANVLQEPQEHQSHTPVPEQSLAADTTVALQGGLAYQKRMLTGNLAEPVAVDDLDKERASVRENLVDRSLDILNSHNDVTFELADLISAAVAKAIEPGSLRSEIGSTLIQSLISLQMEDDFRDQGKKIAASAHLLALTIQDKDFYEAVVEELKENFSLFLQFIKIFPNQVPEESSPWIGHVLVILERLLAEDQLPPQISWTPPTNENPEEAAVEAPPEPIFGLDEKNQLFDSLIEVLPHIGKDESLALSVMRVLVMLTRTRKIAQRLAEKRNIQRLFLMVRQLAGITNEGLRSAFMIALRHIIEDDAMIRQIMRSEIQQMFDSRDRRQTDTTGYTRQMYYLAIRAPEIFVDVTHEKLQLARFDPNQRPQTLMLKKDESATEGEDSNSSGASNEMPKNDQPKETSEAKQPVLERTKTSDLKLPVVENPDGIIHYLLCELLAYKEVDDKPAPTKAPEKDEEPQQQSSANAAASSSETPDVSTEQTKPEKVDFKAENHPIYVYRCFILKCLAELLQSYNRTKIEFINFSRKADPYATTPSKPRSGVLNYLLNVLVPVGSLNHEGDLAFKKKLATSSCAIDVIVSLCAKTGEQGVSRPRPDQSPYAETEPELLFVRKFVLEHCLKAFKDACGSDEVLDMKYSRLLGVADIFSKLVSQRPNGEMLNQNADLTPTLKQMAKIMYEKNFISILTTAIADIDLNFPNAKRVVKYILKPLKWLTYVGMDLSTRYDTSSAPDSTDEYEISSASDDDLMDTTREETPDLFRNSTLGMFEPGNESETDEDDDEDEEDEDMYGEAYADDMEFDEELGDNDEVVSEDEEMEMDLGDIGPIEGLPGDVDVEIELDDDGEGMGSHDESQSDDEDDSEDDDEDDEDDGDEDDDMGDLEEIEDMEDMEEITGDDENASLADDREDSWSDDGAEVHPALNFVLDRPQLLDQIRQGDLDDFIDDDMQEDEDEEEEEDFDEEDIVYDPGLEDDDEGMHEMGWDWNEPAPPSRHLHRLSPWMFPGGPDNRVLVPAYRSHRPGAGPRMADDGVNPLLQRSGRTAGRHGDPSSANNSDWVHAIEGRGPRLLPSDTSPVSFISNLLNAMSQGTLHTQNGTVHLSFNNLPLGPHGFSPPFDPTFRRDVRTRDNPLGRSAREDPQSSVAFLKAYTHQRWQEEARILYGPSAIEKSQRVVNSILKLMVPPAMEAQKKRQADKEAELERRRKEEQERKEQKEREDREEKERQERERLEAEREAAATQAGQAAVEGEQAESTAATQPESQAMEGVEAAQPSTQPEQPAEPQQRITVNLRGHEYDITELGIDLEYLEALPEDLREEVLLSQIQEHRAQQRAVRREQEQRAAIQQPQGESQDQPAGDQQAAGIDDDFLAALPPDIRNELLQHEAQERRRQEREEQRRRSQTNAPAQAEDIDPASFLASLDPALRQAVLMDQDEDMLRQLPPEISAEARSYGGDRRLNQFDYLPSGFRRTGDRGADRDVQSQKRKARPCAQMLDKAGVATLLRLMFIPQQGSAKASLTQILRYVCENRQNRAEVISILLSILQDGSADVNAVERSFAQLSLRAKQTQQQPSDKTPKFSRKNGAFSINSDVSPLMVVQQCLNTLTQLTEKNPAVWTFFLTEHETGVGFKNRTNRKGKAKETKATKYPVNALLSLLDRKLIIDSSSIMEQLTTLLRIITVPLQHMKKEKEKAETEAEKKDDTPAAATSTAAEVDRNREQPTTVQQQSEDVEMATDSQNETAIEVAVVGGASSSKPEASKAEEDKKKHGSLTPPEIPENNLRLVAKILAARECSAKVFQETLSVISNLSPIPGAKEIFGQELLGIAQELARSILRDLSDLTVQVTNAASPTDVQGLALSNFSPASSDQTKLLRALTALDYLFDPTRDNKEQSGAVALEPAQKDDILISLYEDAAFAPLWNKLSECLTVIRQRGNMLNIATTLLPLIETLMVVCKNTTLKDAPLGKMVNKDFALSSPPPESKMENLFFNFTEDHRKILNDLVRQNPKLMSGTFSLLVKNSKVLEFDNKRNYFTRKLHARTPDRQQHPPLQLAVRRDQVFLDSFKSLYFKTADEMKYGKLSIRFHGEEGVDAGGVTREWFQVIARQMFNPDYALFIPVASDRTTFHPNRLSSINPEHLMFFKFIGRVIGKALYEGRVLDCHFSRAVYKRILSRPVNVKDMESLDEEYYKSLVWILNNDPTDVIPETFSVETERFGETEVVDLIENGRNIPLTEENKHDYVRLVTEYRLTGAVQEQLEHFLKGFHDIIPSDLVSIFSEQELELLISGLPDINIEDWKANTEYSNYTQNSPQIHWFWRAVRSFDKEEQAKLLQFVTGTSKVPLNGFKELEGMNGFSKFNIHRDYGSKDRLPSSHTCFNQLDLPEYDDYESLKKALYTAMTAGGEYFGFA